MSTKLSILATAATLAVAAVVTASAADARGRHFHPGLYGSYGYAPNYGYAHGGYRPNYVGGPGYGGDFQLQGRNGE
jgi:hypothetical protein